LPIVRYRTNVAGIEYAFEAFAFPAADDSLAPLFNWVRVRVQNRSQSSQTARFAVAPRFNPHASQISFDPNWRYKVEGRFLYRNERVLLALPEMSHIASFVSAALPPETPAGKVEYGWTLAPEESRALVFCMPATPMPTQTMQAQNALAADFDKRRDKAILYWQNLLSRGMQITVPEPKVNAAWRANLIYNMMAPLRGASHFDLLDLAHAVRLLDLTGHPDLAKVILQRAWSEQKPDERLFMQTGRWGEAGPWLWAFGQQVALTGDLWFGRENYAVLKKIIHAMHEARRRDPWQLLPAASSDAANKRRAYSTSDNLYAILGLRHAIQLARVVGAPEDVSFFTREYEALNKAFLRKLDEVMKATGYIPFMLEQNTGFDQGNFAVVYPTQIMTPWDERVTATLDRRAACLKKA
jgi:hypothetical protein